MTAKMLDDAFLDLLEIEMIRIQDLARPAEIVNIGRDLAPRELERQLDITARDLVIGSRRGHAIEAFELFLDLFLDQRGKMRFLHSLAQLRYLALLGTLLPKLPLDRAQLLAQQVFALLAGHFRLRLARDLGS